MAEEPRERSDAVQAAMPRRLTGTLDALFLRAEYAIYALLGAVLAATAGLALFDATGYLVEALRTLGGARPLLEVVDKLLLVLMIVEILHTVRVSMRSGRLSCKPFLIIGLIASIRRVLVITLQSSEVMHDPLKAEQQELFRISMIELGVLAGLILVMVVSIFLLHRAGEDARSAADEG